MSVWTMLWVLIFSVVAALGTRNAYRLYRQPREVRTGVMNMDAGQAGRAALAALIALPLVWLLIVLSSFGLLGRLPF